MEGLSVLRSSPTKSVVFNIICIKNSRKKRNEASGLHIQLWKHTYLHSNITSLEFFFFFTQLKKNYQIIPH